MSSARQTASELYHWAHAELLAIKNHWNTDPAASRAQLETFLRHLARNCSNLASAAWDKVVEGTKNVLDGINGCLNALVKYVSDHQEELQAAQVKVIGWFDRKRAVTAFWGAADDFCKALRSDSLYEDEAELSAKPKMG